MQLNREEIENRFGHHKATIEGPNPSAETHAVLRQLFKTMARKLDKTLPDGREKSIALTELESTSMWAHKALAKNQPLETEK